MHTAWVKFEKVVDCFRHFFGMCEVAATLGPVLEIDMNTIAKEKIRAKVGIRDYEKIPPYTEITNKELMMYRVIPELGSVVEMAGMENTRDNTWMKLVWTVWAMK